MKMRSWFVVISAVACLTAFAFSSYAQLPSPNFSIRKVSANEFDDFNVIFGEMRGPLRSEIMKDRKDDFENADPLKYLQKVKDECKPADFLIMLPCRSYRPKCSLWFVRYLGRLPTRQVCCLSR